MKKSELKIALFGAHINSSNLGCKALTYSLIYLLEEISDDLGILFKYIVFEYDPNIDETKRMSDSINIDFDKIESIKILPVYKMKSYVKHFKENIDIINKIRKCDFAIDITAGDSFSDIYGFERFEYTTRIKKLVENLKVPLVLGPQTYGPFLSDKSKKLASSVIQNAFALIARDEISANVASKLGNRKIEYTTDLAFQLPYNKQNKKADRKIKVGLNISGLLTEIQAENKTVRNFELCTDYDEYINSVLSWLANNSIYEVYLISHVQEDYTVCEKYHELYKGTILVRTFDDPVEIKSFISGMDLFIGARMHATIAAFTSGVATIPIAYSRKFESLFNTVGYTTIVDLQTFATEKSIDKTIEYIINFNKIENECMRCLSYCSKYDSKTKNFFETIIDSLV